jgi:hypothetical protein
MFWLYLVVIALEFAAGAWMLWEFLWHRPKHVSPRGKRNVILAAMMCFGFAGLALYGALVGHWKQEANPVSFVIAIIVGLAIVRLSTWYEDWQGERKEREAAQKEREKQQFAMMLRALKRALEYAPNEIEADHLRAVIAKAEG